MMEKQSSAPRREDFIVGDWRVEPSCNRIFHRGGGVERKLEPRLMHLLCCLAANPGRTLSRDELVAELWPRVIVTENSLTRAVSALRKHLAAAGSGLVKIETVPKKGYRLIVEQVANANAIGWRRALPWSAFALPAFAATIFATAWLAETSADPAAPYRYDVSSSEAGREFVPVSTDRGGLAQVRHEAPVLSADGGRFAFIRHDASGSTVWLGDLHGGNEPVAVYNSDRPLANLVWSPAGNALLFARQAAVATAALYGGEGAVQLLQFDLTTWTVSTLVEESERADAPRPAAIDLT